MATTSSAQRLPEVCPREVHEAIKADPARLAAETYPIGRSMGLRLLNCRHCESTLAIEENI